MNVINIGENDLHNITAKSLCKFGTKRQTTPVCFNFDYVSILAHHVPPLLPFSLLLSIFPLREGGPQSDPVHERHLGKKRRRRRRRLATRGGLVSFAPAPLLSSSRGGVEGGLRRLLRTISGGCGPAGKIMFRARRFAYFRQMIVGVS